MQGGPCACDVAVDIPIVPCHMLVHCIICQRLVQVAIGHVLLHQVHVALHAPKLIDRALPN